MHPMLDFLNDLFKRYLVEVVLGITVGLWWAFRERLKDKAATIRRLKEDIERREIELGKMRRDLTAAKSRCDDLEQHVPQAALGLVEKELADNDDGPAHRAVVEWFEADGETVSKLLLRRAEWTAARAAGEMRAMGLAAASAYATAAVALHPEIRRHRSGLRISKASNGRRRMYFLIW